VISTELKHWGKLIANADITDPLIFGRQISAYSALWKYMKDEPEMISMISKALRGIDLSSSPSAPAETKKVTKSVRARAGQSLIYFATHCPRAIMDGFDELWGHYQQSLDAIDTQQRSAWVLLTVLFIVKYVPWRHADVAIGLKMRGRWRNGRDGLMGLWARLLSDGILGYLLFLLG
jgi:Exportin-5 family